jgi:hypothetical protein
MVRNPECIKDRGRGHHGIVVHSRAFAFPEDGRYMDGLKSEKKILKGCFVVVMQNEVLVAFGQDGFGVHIIQAYLPLLKKGGIYFVGKDTIG